MKAPKKHTRARRVAAVIEGNIGLVVLAGAGHPRNWVLVKGRNLSCYNEETILFIIDLYSGNLKVIP